MGSRLGDSEAVADVRVRAWGVVLCASFSKLPFWGVPFKVTTCCVRPWTCEGFACVGKPRQSKVAWSEPGRCHEESLDSWCKNSFTLIRFVTLQRTQSKKITASVACVCEIH